ncbi:MAG: DUF4013 domain-containing protein [Anaerolineae bacterium]
MDIGSAFTFIFDDEDWIKKLLIGGVILLFAIPLSVVLVGIALFLPIAGYMLQTLQNVRDRQATPLPEWSDFGGLFSKGLMVTVVYIVYLIPIIILACASFGVAFAMNEASSDAVDVLAIVNICLSCLQIIVGLAIGLFLPGALIFYAEHEQFGDAFKFGEILSFIKSNLGDYIIVFLVTWVAQFIAQFGVILCLVGVFVTGFWALLVQSNLFGQLARKRMDMGTVDASFSAA